MISGPLYPHLQVNIDYSLLALLEDFDIVYHQVLRNVDNLYGRPLDGDGYASSSVVAPVVSRDETTLRADGKRYRVSPEFDLSTFEDMDIVLAVWWHTFGHPLSNLRPMSVAGYRAFLMGLAHGVSPVHNQ